MAKPEAHSSAGRRTIGSVVAFVGFLLSPLSWWNDVVINLPLALAFGWLVSCFRPSAFGVSVVVGYWLTNVLGLVMMHWGVSTALDKRARTFSKGELFKDILIAGAYTALIIVLVKLHIVGPLPATSLVPP